MSGEVRGVGNTGGLDDNRVRAPLTELRNSPGSPGSRPRGLLPDGDEPDNPEAATTFPIAAPSKVGTLTP